MKLALLSDIHANIQALDACLAHARAQGAEQFALLGDFVGYGAAGAGRGLGMALLYPNLSAAVADISHPNWRGSAIGIYHFWRDLGYGICGLGLGIVDNSTGHMEAAFWFVALSMFASGGVLWLLGEETHPRLNPAR